MKSKQQIQHISGVPCPQCNSLIPVSIQQTLNDFDIICPNCGLKLYLDHKPSQKAIEMLKKLQEQEHQ